MLPLNNQITQVQIQTLKSKLVLQVEITYFTSGAYTETPGTINPAATYFMRFKLTQQGTKVNSAEDCTISFTNNSVTRTFEINAQITSGLGRCIHELMLVDTPMGQKSIYDLNIGDLVNSYNYELDMMESVPIKEIIQPTHENLYKVNRLILTEDHPIFDINGKTIINKSRTIKRTIWS